MSCSSSFVSSALYVIFTSKHKLSISGVILTAYCFHDLTYRNTRAELNLLTWLSEVRIGYSYTFCKGIWKQSNLAKEGKNNKQMKKKKKCKYRCRQWGGAWWDSRNQREPLLVEPPSQLNYRFQQTDHKKENISFDQSINRRRNQSYRREKREWEQI